MADLRAQGRPRRNGEELVVVSVKVPASQATRLRRVADEREVSLSRLLRERLWLESVGRTVRADGGTCTGDGSKTGPEVAVTLRAANVGRDVTQVTPKG